MLEWSLTGHTLAEEAVVAIDHSFHDPRSLRHVSQINAQCARKLDESSLLAFFEEVFRHHMGEGNEREEGESSWVKCPP